MGCRKDTLNAIVKQADWHRLHKCNTNASSLMRTAAGKPRGYAFVEYESKADMKTAYKMADGRKIEGKRVTVDVERGRTVPNWRAPVRGVTAYGTLNLQKCTCCWSPWGMQCGGLGQVGIVPLPSLLAGSCQGQFCCGKQQAVLAMHAQDALVQGGLLGRGDRPRLQGRQN